jgi:deoxyhypusine synthase
MQVDIRKHLVPLEMIDVQKCVTVGKTVEQMEKAAIGARMIGEAARTITNWVEAGKTPRIIFDDPESDNDGFYATVDNFARKLYGGRLADPAVITSEYYAEYDCRNPIVVLGNYSNRWKEYLFERGPDEAIFINDINRPPSWVRDGYFHGFVNADPRLIIPILFRVYLERINGWTEPVWRIIKGWEACGGVGHQAAHGFETFRRMIEDPDCTVIATMSGIMTMAKMGGLIGHMIDEGWAQAVAATGALIGHGFVEGVGLKHFKYDPHFDDNMMADQKLNRITDTVEPEENLDHVEEIMSAVLSDQLSKGGTVNPSEINRLIGMHLSRKYPNEPSILRSAFEKGVPIFIPAFHDSELGNDLLIHNWRSRIEGRPEIIVNQEIDSLLLVDIMTGAKKLGIFSLGGGVPRNNMQNGAPLVEIMNVRLGLGLRENKYAYGCRICPDQTYLGHLSGCTYSENASWRKTDIEHGRFSEVMADATMVYPFYMAAMQEIMEGK